MKTLVAAVISLAHLIAALPAFQHMSSDVFAISAYESGFQHGMNDAAAVCNLYIHNRYHKMDSNYVRI